MNAITPIAAAAPNDAESLNGARLTIANQPDGTLNLHINFSPEFDPENPAHIAMQAVATLLPTLFTRADELASMESAN